MEEKSGRFPLSVPLLLLWLSYPKFLIHGSHHYPSLLEVLLYAYQEHLGDSCVCNYSQLWVSWLRVVLWRQNITIGAFGCPRLPAVFAPLLPPAPFVSHYFNYPNEGRLIFNSR